ncbi:MAG: LysM peptidoglycan-binding domain-containing protein [Paracoccaceae bacterium]|nr:LysM peptidoglycan-binding domain-containing protein [Paracoccaceae bacterium]
MTIIRSIWFWMGVLGVSVVSYGVFDAMNNQKQVLITAVENEIDQQDKSVKIEENKSVAESVSSEVVAAASLEEDPELAETNTEDGPLIVSVEVFLDTARVDPNGLVTIAGRAEKGALIEVLLGQNLIGTISVGNDGNFASIFEVPSSEEIRVLVLRTKKGEDFVYADESLVILPSQITDESGDENLQGSEDVARVDNSDEVTSIDTPQIEGSNVFQKQATIKLNDDASLEAEEGFSTTNEATGKVSNGQQELVKDLSTTNSDQIIVEDPKVTEKADLVINSTEGSDSNSVDKGQDISIENANEDLNDNTDSNAFKPKVVIANSDGVKVIQDGKKTDDELALDSIAYDPLGNVTVGGRSNPSGLVRFYINNEAVSATKTNEAGYWEADLSDIIPGTYTLRIDELSLKGDVISRLETPFKREDRERLANLIAPSTSPVRINIVTVQPGNTLWAIARKRYGDGLLYVQVFEANRDKIKNPDLIYPGQLFDLPDMY